MTEYVRFTHPESLYSRKNLLHTELEFLNIVKKIRSLKEIRKEYFVLKVALKSKIDQLKESLKELTRVLPDDKFGIPIREKLHKEKNIISLEQELEIIRRKIEKLQRDTS